MGNLEKYAQEKAGIQPHYNICVTGYAVICIKLLYLDIGGRGNHNDLRIGKKSRIGQKLFGGLLAMAAIRVEEHDDGGLSPLQVGLPKMTAVGQPQYV